LETEASGDDDAAVKKGDAKKEKPKEIEKPKEEEKKEEPVSTPLVARPAQNWSDLFFIIDILSYNIDSCDLILFMTKINPVPGLENKKVSVDISYLDTTSTTMVVSHTDAGVIESLLGKFQINNFQEKRGDLKLILPVLDNTDNAFTFHEKKIQGCICWLVLYMTRTSQVGGKSCRNCLFTSKSRQVKMTVWEKLNFLEMRHLINYHPPLTLITLP
jgi:hypothetical protein